MKKTVLSMAMAILLTLGIKAQTYTSTPTVSGLSYPVAFAFTPDGRYLVTEKGGVIKIFNANGSLIGNFYNLTDSTFNNFERGLLGIEVDPDFNNNHYVYAYYNHRYPNNNSNNSQQKLRVVRFTENNNLGTNPTIILNLQPGYAIAGNHVGGNLHFRPSEPDKLYITIGELAVTSNAQLLTNPYGKFLRINKDGSIPTDNPFYDDGNPAAGNDDRIWSYGHRNPFDFCFSPINDSLYSSENGQNVWDEMNIVTKGKNYGWVTCEGDYLFNSSTNPCNIPNLVNPIETWGAPLPAVTGVMHYNGCLMPELQNHVLVADNDNGYIYNVELGNAPAYDVVLSRTLLLDVTDHLTTIRQGPDGYIYALQGGYVPSGSIFKIGPTNPPGEVTAVVDNIIPENEGCVGQPISLLALPDNDAQWYEFTLIGENSTYGAMADVQFNSITVNESGNYDLRLVVSNGCQNDTAFIAAYINVFNSPTYTLNSTDAVQGGSLGSAWLSNYSDVNSIQWLDANQTPISQNDTVQNLAAGTYYVIITNGLQTPACSVTDTVVISLLSSISELTAAGINLYPNPAHSQLYINLSKLNIKPQTALVYNSLGTLVYSQAINGQNLVELNTANLPTGMYYLQLSGGTKPYTTKWMKE